MGKIKVKKTRSGRILLYIGSQKLGKFRNKEAATKFILDKGLNQRAKS